MSESQPTSPAGNGQPQGERRPYAEDEVSLLDILLVIARHKRLIVRTVLVVTVLGVLYAVLAPMEYTSTARVVREAQAEGGSLPGGISALRGLGINLGGAASGLTPEAYPSILTSREVRLAVVRDTFYFADEDARTTFVAYVDQPPGALGQVLKYTLRLPWTLKGALMPAAPRPVGTDSSGRPVYPTEAEEEAIKAVADRVSSSVDQESGLMTINVTAGEPGLAAALADRFLEHLAERVRTIRTDKARQNVAFVAARFEEAQDELRAAEERLAQFTDRNQRINSAQLRTEQERLQRQVRFASDLYSELQTQLTQARLELQRSAPVITVVEEPVPPMERSAPKRTLIVLLSLILGGFLGIGVAFVSAFFDGTEDDAEEQEKLDEIRERLVPARYRTLKRASTRKES